jgi:hypothetical protein
MQHALEIIKLELESIQNKKALIKMYSGFDDKVSRIIVEDSRDAIKQSQESIQFFAKHAKA